VTQGLCEALQQRATAIGLSRARYVLLWLADLADDRLKDLTIVPLETGEMCPDRRHFCLRNDSEGNRVRFSRPRLRSARTKTGRRRPVAPVPSYYPRKPRANPEAGFRRQLSEMLVPWVRAYVPGKALADHLGVTTSALRDAAMASMKSVQRPSRAAAGLARLDMQVPEFIAEPLARWANESTHARLSDVIRWILYATVSGERQQGPLPPRYHPDTYVDTICVYDERLAHRTIHRARRRHLRVSIGVRLYDLISLRAARAGLTIDRYATRWLYEFVAGRLRDLSFRPIEHEEIAAFDERVIVGEAAS